MSKFINYKVIALVWVFLWLLFSVRGYVLTERRFFKNTLGRDSVEKKRYLMTEGLYDFIEICRKKIPEKDDFVFVYDTKAMDPVERSRVMYYLYPRKMRDDAPYIMVFGLSGYRKEGFELLERFNESSYILRKAD